MSYSPESTNNGPAFQAILPGYCEPLNFTGTSGYSQIFEADTTLVELFATEDCWLQIIVSTDNTTVAQAGSSGAKSLNKFLPGGITAFLGVPVKRGLRYKIVVIRNSDNGTLYITEGATV